MAKKLTSRQHAFVRHYVGTARFNATQAAVKAGYSEKTARSIGSENLTKPDILAAIEEALSAECASEAEALHRTTSRARGTFAPFLRVTGDGEVLFALHTDEAQAHYHLLKRVKQRRTETVQNDVTRTEVTTEVELHDSQRADDILLRHYRAAASRDVSPETPAASTPLPGVRVELPDNGR